MDKNVRAKLREEIQVLMRLNPNIKASKLTEQLKNCNTDVDFNGLDPNTLNHFVRYNMSKFNQLGQCTKHKGGNGRPVHATSPKVTKKVGKKLIKSPNSSIRKVSKAVGISYGSVRNIIKNKLNCKAYHKRKVQKMTKQHKSDRVDCAKWLLEDYGTDLGAYSKWSRLANSDFSAIIRVTGSVNTKNDVIWAETLKDAGDLVEFSEEKFGQGEMVFGVLTVRGLLPKSSPVFVSDLLKTYKPQPKTVNAKIYADMLDNIIGPAAKALYPRGNIIWQDDPAKIHHARVSLDAVQRNFRYRLDYERQAAKMADVWPIENVWAMLKAEVKAMDPQTKEELRSSIKKAWARMAKDEALCKKLIASIPARLQAVIKKKGRQIVKEDYH